MTGSTLSLDSLSSPSPSPSPPPESTKLAEPSSAAGLGSDSELSELTEEEQEADKRKNAPRKGPRNGVSHRGGRPSRRGGRRKTSSLVPAPMWGWAETKSSNVVEEEEEEEIANPPHAMEEEEDDDAHKNHNDDDDEEEEEEEDNFNLKSADDPPEEDDPHADDDDNPAFLSADDASPYRSRRSTRKPSLSRDASTKDEDDMDVDVDEDLEEASDSERRPLAEVDAPESEDDNANQTETEDEGADDKKPHIVVNGGELTTNPATPMEMDVDVDAQPSPSQAAPLAVAVVAASSIMAGATLLEPVSPSSSQRSTPASSRSASPVPGSDAEDAGDLHDGADEKDDDDTAAISVGADVDATEQEGAEEQDQEGDDVDVDDTNGDDDVDNEVESDLQPAHRAEALDVLATIEFKFALLRERVYVEKMDSLAWEESLVNEGTHPELLHLQRELSSRRDKRIQLATRKQSLEVANVHKRRRTDEDGVWSWWKFARDDLQTEMIAETNRKRRRMERERRTNERPPPIAVRSIPSINQEYPSAPPLRKVIKAIPFAHLRSKASKRANSSKLLFPELASLTEYDIEFDLECIVQQQRERYRVNIPLGGYDVPHGHRVPHQGGHLNGAVHGGYATGTHPIGYDGYPDSGNVHGSRAFPGGPPINDHRMPTFQSQGPPSHLHLHPPPPPQAQPVVPHSHSHTPFAGPPGSRNIHMQQPAPHSSHSHHSQLPPQPGMGPPFGAVDADVPMHPPHHSHGHGPPPPHAPQYYPSRRSVSPPIVNGGPSHKNLDSGVNGGSSWMGSGMGMERVYTGSGAVKGHEWGRDRERDGRLGPEDDERERMAREREKRDRERDRDQRERERERDLQREWDRERDDIERERQRDIHHIHHQHRGQPMHLSQASHHHHHVAPHHHHRPHHHHVVHHHHQPSSGVPPSHSSTSVPPQVLRSPRNVHRDRGDREYDSRPQSGHNQHPTEVINLTSSKPNHSLYHDPHPSAPDFRDARSKHGLVGGGRSSVTSTPMEDTDRPLPIPFAIPPSQHGISPPNHAPAGPNSSMNGRKSPRNSWSTSEKDNYRGGGGTSSSGPPSGPPPSGPYHNSPSHESGAPHSRSPNQSHRFPPINGSSISRGPQGPSGSSSQQPSRQNSIGLHSPPRSTLPSRPPPPAPAAPPSPTSTNSAPYPPPPSNANPSRSPSRFATPRSPPMNLKLRPSSPLSNKISTTSTSSSSYPALSSGSGRTSTPTLETKANNGHPGPSYSAGGRNTETNISMPSSGGRFIGQNGTSEREREQRERDMKERERERERPLPPLFGPPPPPAPSKMSVPQMVDGH